MKTARFLALSLALSLILAAATARAGDLVYFNEGQLPDPARIASALAAPPGPESASDGAGIEHGRTRAVRLLDANASPPAQGRIAPAPRPTQMAALDPQAAPGRVASVGAIALALKFSFDSSEVHPANHAQLDAVAEGLKRLPENAMIHIAGHTDAYGHPLYNLDLSLKRAMAVREYFVRVHGIPRGRIVAVGKGKSAPYNRANPYAPENRRVQIHAEYDQTAQTPVIGARSVPNG